LDRLGRSLPHLIEKIKGLDTEGIGFLVSYSVPAVPGSAADRLNKRLDVLETRVAGVGNNVQGVKADTKAINDAASNNVAGKACFVHSEANGQIYVNTVVPVPQNTPSAACH
jgi:hypothetical protein